MVEPVLRVRHAITNTNYYAQIFSEATVVTSEFASETDDAEEEQAGPRHDGNEDEAVYEAPEEFLAGEMQGRVGSLLSAIPVREEDLRWVGSARLRGLPLTGLARKSLQRLGVMALPPVRMG